MILTPEQFQQICERLDEPFRTMVVIAMCLGLRVSEILALKWSDILVPVGRELGIDRLGWHTFRHSYRLLFSVRLYLKILTF